MYLEKIVTLPLSEAIAFGSALFPNIESLHVVAITLVLGTIAIVDLRLLGFQAHRPGIQKIINELLPYTWGAFAVAAASGTLLFISNATTYAHNGYFQAKFVLIALAGINMAIFHMTAFKSIADWDRTMPPPTAARVAGGLSLSLWVGVIFLGRWVGFS